MKVVMPGTLYVIAAPSGAGKTSLVNALVKTLKHVKVSISHTTRPQRPDEENGVHYWFTSPEQFKKMTEQDIFLEHATVFGYEYGTSQEWVLENLKAGIDVVLEIDWQGARQIRQQFPHSTSVFILPPSRDLLRERLIARAQDDIAVIEKRLNAAGEEMQHYKEFDYLIVNDVFDLALADLQTIVRANRLSAPKQALKHAELLAELLKKQ